MKAYVVSPNVFVLSKSFKITIIKLNEYKPEFTNFQNNVTTTIDMNSVTELGEMVD